MEMEEIKSTETENSKTINAEMQEDEFLSHNTPVKPKNTGLYTESLVFKFMLVFGVVFMGFIFVFQILLTPIMVVGASMQPTMNVSITSDNDDTHCDIVYYKSKDTYLHDEIVIIANTDYKYIKKTEKQDVKSMIKRIIACPGDIVTFYLTHQEPELLPKKYYYDIIVKDRDGKTVELDESYLTEEMCYDAISMVTYINGYANFEQIFQNIQDINLPDDERKYSLTVPENSYFVMGDNRNVSEDSRFFGCVNISDISGSVRFAIPYGKTIFEALWIKLKSIT
ncbi:MAG: signal peptidase I [Clostridia bacterium]|nr:signal peptidase I [Clostridia bacterium]